MTHAWLTDAQQRELLQASAIDPAVVAERGYRSMQRPTNSNGDGNSRTELDRLGIPSWATKEDRFYPGLLIPMFRATGELIAHQFKPYAAPMVDGKHRKYASTKGQPNHIDVHPRWSADRGGDDPTLVPFIRDIGTPLWITEGIKKADSLTSRGCVTIALTGVFNWRSQLGTLGDWEDVPLKGRSVILCFDSDARPNRNVARAMGRLGKWLESKGAAAVAYVVVPEEFNGAPTKGVDDYFAAGGTVQTLAAASSLRPPNPDGANGTFTDAMLADTVADEALAGRFRWARGLGWLGWGGRRWERVAESAVVEAVRLYVIDRFQAALEKLKRSGDGDASEVNGWKGVLSRSKLAALVKLAEGIVGVRADELDAYPDLLNAANGVVDLTTGWLHPHDPALLLTKLAPVAYDPAARHDDWDAALRAVPADVLEWYQLRLGQAVTGYMTPDDLLVVQSGSGENGKTTITTGISAALGDYYTLVSHRALLASPDAHPTELMDFQGVRVALLEETPEERRLNVTRLKQAVGTPRIKARYIRQDDVEFEATHSLFLSTNYLPVLEETDHGTWRRLACLRFPYRWLKPGQVATGENDRPGDPTLRERVRLGEYGQHEAVLAWLVYGAVKWYAAGKIMPELPERVVSDTRTWRGDTDLVQGYLDGSLVPDLFAHVTCRDLLAEFNAWLVENQHRPWSDRTFSSRFGGHGDVVRLGIEKRLVRASEALSRPTRPWVLPVVEAANYKAWVGVRFRTKDDP